MHYEKNDSVQKVNSDKYKQITIKGNTHKKSFSKKIYKKIFSQFYVTLTNEFFRFYEKTFFLHNYEIYSNLIYPSFFIIDKLKPLYDQYIYKDFEYHSFYYIQKIFFHKIPNLTVFVLSETNKSYNGYIFMACNHLNNKSKMIDFRIRKSFFLQNNKKKENKEIYLYNIMFNIAKQNGMKLIFLNDENNFYDYQKKRIVHFFNVYNSNKIKKSWFVEKLGFTTIPSKKYEYIPFYHFLIKNI